MFMTNAELEVFLLYVVRHVAAVSHIADIDLKGRTELMGELREVNGNLSGRLQDFVIAYVNWYYFHNELEQLDVAGRLDQETHEQLHKRIAKRDATRAALLQAIEDLA
jgi:hypothetical protein